METHVYYSQTEKLYDFKVYKLWRSLLHN
jgi:hypothetical protein